MPKAHRAHPVIGLIPGDRPRFLNKSEYDFEEKGKRYVKEQAHRSAGDWLDDGIANTFVATEVVSCRVDTKVWAILSSN